MKRDALPSIAPVADAPTSVQASWRMALPALGAAMLWVVFCFFGTAASMVGIWARSETFAHGFVVAPISIWLVWRMRARLRLMTPQPSWIVLPLLAAAGFAWLLGEVGAVNAVAQFAFVAILALTVPAVLGTRIARAMLFPLGFLFFSVPFGEFLMPTLMSHTADFTVLGLRASGVPVYREGLQLVIPSGRWSIVEACSGIRYLIASVMVGTLFAYLNFTTLWRRLAFVAFAITVPIVANWLRAYMIVMIGHLSDNRLATGVDHIIYGWLFFGLVMLIMFAVGARWQEPVKAHTTAVTGDEASHGGRLSPVNVWPAALAFMAVAAVWPLLDHAIELHDANPSAALSHIDVPGWQASTTNDPAFTPHFETPSAVRHESVRRGDVTVGLYIAYYRGQNAEHKLVSSENVLLRNDDRVWHAVQRDVRTIDIGGRSTRVAATRLLRAADGSMLATRQWYWIDGALTSSDAIAKARIAWSRILGHGDDSAVIVIYAPAGRGQDADETLRGFARDAWPSIEAALDEAKAR